MARPRISDAKQREVVALLRSGLSSNQAARTAGISQPSASRIARANGISLNQIRTEKAREALLDFDVTERLKLSNEMLAKARAMLASIDKPSELQSLAMTLAILTDKRRLEEGQVTDRLEHRDARAELDESKQLLKLVSDRRAAG